MPQTLLNPTAWAGDSGSAAWSGQGQKEQETRGWTNLARGAPVQVTQPGSSRTGRANKAPSLQALPEHAPSVCRCSGPATGAGEQAPLVRTAGLSRQPRGTLGMAPGARSDGADPGVSVPVAAKGPLRCSQGRLGLSLPCCSILHSQRERGGESSPNLPIPALTVLLQLWKICCCFNHWTITIFLKNKKKNPKKRLSSNPESVLQ